MMSHAAAAFFDTAEDFHVAFPFLFFHEFQACFFRIRKPVCVIVSEILQEAILSV